MLNNIGLFTKKLGMTHIFDSNQNLIPVTILKTSYSIVTNIAKIKNSNNFKIVISSWPIKPSKPKLKKAKYSFFAQKSLPYFKYTKEYINAEINPFNIGDSITLHVFQIGEQIKASGLTIGKGFTGNIKRHGFHRGPMSHGSKHHRLQGSLGAGTTPGRVFPGKKMSGHTGNKKRTVAGLTILNLDFLNNLIYLKGSIPGKKNNLIHIQKY